MSHSISEVKPTLAGVIGYFDAPESLIQATKQVRDAQYPCFDVFTPYPVHGMDAAQGLRRSPVPFVTFIAGLTGGSLGFFLQYWTSAVDWPLNVAGKPMNSWPAFMPITFEFTVLFAGLATAGAMLFFNALPNHRKKSFDPSLTNNRFALVIEAPSTTQQSGRFKKFDEIEAAGFLRSVGAQEVRTVFTEGWFGA